MIEKFDAFHDTQNGIDNQQLTHCFMSARALVKLNDLVDTVNRLEESVQGVVNNSINDGGRIRLLQEQIHALKTTMAKSPAKSLRITNRAIKTISVPTSEEIASFTLSSSPELIDDGLFLISSGKSRSPSGLPKSLAPSAAITGAPSFMTVFKNPLHKPITTDIKNIAKVIISKTFISTPQIIY